MLGNSILFQPKFEIRHRTPCFQNLDVEKIQFDAISLLIKCLFKFHSTQKSPRHMKSSFHFLKITLNRTQKTLVQLPTLKGKRHLVTFLCSLVDRRSPTSCFHNRFNPTENFCSVDDDFILTLVSFSSDRWRTTTTKNEHHTTFFIDQPRKKYGEQCFWTQSMILIA